MLKKGDRVRVPKWMAIGNHFNRGVITHINGAYIFVKLNYKGVMCVPYINEVITGWR
jgi:hypothetical protein